MKKFSLLFSVLFFQSIGVTGPALSFLDPAFNRLDPLELASLKKSRTEDRDQILYFEAEALYLRGKLQASQQLLNSLQKKCLNGESKARSDKTEVLCFLSELGFSPASKNLKLLFEKEKVQKVLKAIQGGSFSFEERIYLEGRLLWQIPSELGGSSSKSLLGWESLKRLRPDLSSADFYMSLIYERQGKNKLAGEAFERALSHDPPDPRSVLVRKPQGIPMPGRFYFGVIGNPAGGVGITVGRREERLLDKDRTLDVSLSAQSRGVYAGRLFYQDRESIKPIILFGHLLAASEIDQFFGLGSQSKLNELTEIAQARSEGAIGIQKRISSFYGKIELGWFLREPSSVTGFWSKKPEVRENQKSIIPSFQIGFKDDKQLHAFFQISGAAKGLLSSHFFEVYRLGVQKRFYLMSASELELRTELRWVTGQKPFGMLTELSGNLNLPGVRKGRFRAERAWHSTLEWSWPLWQALSGSLFGNLASLEGTLLTGGGAALIVGQGGFRSRIEIGQFAGETVIQTGVQFFSE